MNSVLILSTDLNSSNLEDIFAQCLFFAVKTSLSLPASHQGVEVFPGVRQAVDALGVAVREQKFVFIEQSKRFLHWANGGVDTNLRLPDLEKTEQEINIRKGQDEEVKVPMCDVNVLLII